MIYDAVHFKIECPECGKKCEVFCSRINYQYKVFISQKWLYFCSWSCMIKYLKKHDPQQYVRIMGTDATKLQAYMSKKDAWKMQLGNSKYRALYNKYCEKKRKQEEEKQKNLENLV